MQKLIAGARELGFELNRRQLEQFEIYYRELADWNQRLNLTAITGYEEVQVKHFLDSISIIPVFKPAEGSSIIDVGTGAGLPGVPLKILFPDVKLVLLEATAKKARFLEHVTRQLGLDNSEIVVGRAEEAAHEPRYREQFDAVLSRAVAPLAALVELTLPFCAKGGSLIAQKKGAIEGEINLAKRAIGILGGDLREVKRVELEGLEDERYLVMIDKVSPTPDIYPRRPGIPTKRPIM